MNIALFNPFLFVDFFVLNEGKVFMKNLFRVPPLLLFGYYFDFLFNAIKAIYFLKMKKVADSFTFRICHSTASVNKLWGDIHQLEARAILFPLVIL